MKKSKRAAVQLNQLGDIETNPVGLWFINTGLLNKIGGLLESSRSLLGLAWNGIETTAKQASP